jgi:tetratricopeptide (TPR) repeat protein
MIKILFIAAISAMFMPVSVSCSEKKVEHPHFRKAIQLESYGKLAESVDEYRKELAEYPDNPGARHNLAMVFKMTGRVTEAIEQYREAIRQNESDPLARTGLGQLLVQTGNIDGGIAELRKAIELKTPNVMIYYDLGAALEKKGDAPGAVEMYDKHLNTLGPGTERDFLAKKISDLKKPQQTK